MNDHLPSEKELVLLRTIFIGGPMYAYEACRQSNGGISTSSVYKIAARLIDKGFLSVHTPRDRNHPGIPRPQYRLTKRGTKVLRALDELR